MKSHVQSPKKSKLNRCDSPATDGFASLPRRHLQYNRGLEFFRSISCRYQEMPGRWSRVGLIFARQSSTLRIQSIHHQSPVILKSRLALTLSPRITIQPHKVANLTVIHHERIETRTASVTPTKDGFVPPRANGDWDSARPQIERSYPPLPRVLRRPVHTDAVESTTTAGSTTKGSPLQRKEPSTSDHIRSAPLKPIDVNHLANEVIRTIDRRIVAQRERMGRS